MLVSQPVDEVHHIVAGYIGKQRIFLNVLKFLANELCIPLVAVGTVDAVRAIHTDPQLANRFEPMALPDWDLNREFQMLLASFESTLPLRKPSCLADERLAVKLLSMSEGTIGELSRILVAAAMHAIRSGEERINEKVLRDQLGAALGAQAPCGRTGITMSRPTNLSGRLWAIHLKPLEDELLSSWMIRLARAYEIKPVWFWRLFWPVDFRAVDVEAPGGLLDLLARRTATPFQRALDTTLTAIAREHSVARTIRYCAVCMAEDAQPYFRRRWQLRSFLLCEKHGVPLRNGCPDWAMT